MQRFGFLKHPLFRNKYFIATASFAVWMMFFNQVDIPYVIDLKQERAELEEQRDWYKSQNLQAQKEYESLTQDEETLERFAREEYLMKKSNEDLFVFREKQIEP